MTLLRAVLVLAILVVLAHLGISYAGVEGDLNGLTSGISALGQFLELPASALLGALPFSAEQLRNVDTSNFYVVGFAACAIYFVLWMLLGVGRG